MMHTPIQFKGVGLYFPHKICFEDFSTQIHAGSRIAIIGRNGSGKSTLLQILRGIVSPSEGEVTLPATLKTGYVPQLIEKHGELSGGQRFQAALTEALAGDPDLLLLDEPTNHLDQRNRRSLLCMLQHYAGSLIVVSHDVELLRTQVDTLWHIDQGRIQVFSGQYDDYQQQRALQRVSIEQERTQLAKQAQAMHEKRMQEQQRSAKSKAKGQKSIAQRKWPTVVSNAKADRASDHAGQTLAEIAQKRAALSDRLDHLRLPEVIVPTFGLMAADARNSLCVSISKGQVGYGATPVLTDIHFVLQAGARMALLGDNGSGKSTLVKAILGDSMVKRAGEWYLPKSADIGYLDQHYQILRSNKTVLETIQDVAPNWPYTDVRRHLNAFLFRKNEEVNTNVSQLSGGERARLCLAQIAAQPPRLLILDEITNNLDLETREHMTQVLREYPGTLLMISHDADFLQRIGVVEGYKINGYKEQFKS